MARRAADSAPPPRAAIAGATITADGRFAQSDPIDATIANLRAFTAQNGKAALLYWDPPWGYGERGPESSKDWAIDPSQHYPLIPDSQLRALTRSAVKECCSYNAVMALWAPNSQVALGIDLIRDAGFEFTTQVTWNKIHDTGRHAACMSNGAVRPCSEVLLIAKRGGGLPLKSHAPQISSVVIAQRGAHSAKPEIIREWLTRAYDTDRRIELFSRTPRSGWMTWGNQAAAPLSTIAA
ncbi:MT-A70 family methyltransferase [Dyella psychrodurans]|uniref:Adenine methyltransferase n=1 Tax=Dyella psychrodurans TaxID=1927960 RepID=A0A370XC07_9GAMM|nr:MT-A70 family methyltransferase [Dyella psychrodurans]RDS85832.1 hypothetical protein DWU99_00730 [Dyella psychrodurans]